MALGLTNKYMLESINLNSMPSEFISDYQTSRGLRPIKTLYLWTFQNAVIHEHLPRSPWGDSTTLPWPLTLSVSLSSPGSASSALSPHTKAPGLHHFPGHCFVRVSTHFCTSTSPSSQKPNSKCCSGVSLQIQLLQKFDKRFERKSKKLCIKKYCKHNGMQCV